MKTRIRPWWLVTFVALAYMAVVVRSNDGDPTALAALGTRFTEGDPGGSEGYDGQFAYYIARDPLRGWQYCDVPAYRYQRIVYPLLGRLLAWGNNAWLPYSLALLNIAASGLWLNPCGSARLSTRPSMPMHAPVWHAPAWTGPIRCA